MYPFAVFTHQIGSFSETFVKRHIEELLPDKTVVATAIESDMYGGNWTISCPLLILEHIRKPRLRQELRAAVVKTLGFKYESRPDLKMVRRFLVEHGVRVVLCEYLNEWVQWVPHLASFGMKIFVHAHGYDVSHCLKDPYWRKQYLVYNDADGVITMSRASRERLIDAGISPSKIHIIPYGVDIHRRPKEHREKDVINCISVGRMTGKKAPILLLNAFRQATQKRSDLHLDHIGDGPLMASSAHFIQTFQLTDRVRLHGGQLHQYVLDWIPCADIFLQHSVIDPVTGDEEGLPVAILEAMAHGLPVVSTRHAGIPEAVVDGLTGYLVEEGDTEGMAQRICELANDPELRQKMGEAGRQRVKEHFSWERERAELLKVLGLDKLMVNLRHKLELSA